MKTIIYTIAIIISMCLFSNISWGQNNEGYEFFYKRSSLEMAYIESDDMPDKQYVDNAWNNYLKFNFPVQYNKHGLDINSVPINDIELSVSEIEEAGYNVQTLRGYENVIQAIKNGKNVKVLNSDYSEALLLPDYEIYYKLKLDKYIKDNHIANKLVQRWYMYDKSSEEPFNMELIFARGNYNNNAGDEDVLLNSRKIGRRNTLNDAGTQLIPFTFITFTKLDFYSNEPVAALVRDLAIFTADILKDQSLEKGVNPNTVELIYNMAVTAANTAYSAAKDGYTLKTTTWLYRLHWDNETENIMYDEIWNNPSLIETSDAFYLDYIDSQSNSSIVLFPVNMSGEGIIDLTVNRNISNILKVLQEKNDVFKVLTRIEGFLVNDNLEAPLSVIDKKYFSAYIGTNEGLRGGEIFDVFDSDDNYLGKVTAVKGMVWDNEENNGSYTIQCDKDGNAVTFTTFKGKIKNPTSDMTIRNPQAPKKINITARIGLKEGVDKKSIFEVLSFNYDENKECFDTIVISRVKPIKSQIWDNLYYGSSEEISEMEIKKRSKDGLIITETYFKANKKVKPGMWLRKIK